MARDGLRHAGRVQPPSRISPTEDVGRQTGTFLVGNLLAAVTLGIAPTWPPVDVIIVDVSTNRTLPVWREGGEEGATLMSVLNEDLNSMRLEVFLEEWGLRL